MSSRPLEDAGFLVIDNVARSSVVADHMGVVRLFDTHSPNIEQASVIRWTDFAERAKPGDTFGYGTLTVIKLGRSWT